MDIKQVFVRMRLRVPQTRAEWHHKAEHFFHMTYTGLESWHGTPPLQYVAMGMFGCAVLGVFLVNEAH